MSERTLPFPQPVSTEGKLDALDSVPLFMRSLPQGSVDDVAISALQSLAHEGTPDEVAENFKDQGNEYFKGKRYIEARNFYSQGIDAQPTNPTLLDALLCNRAACNLELKNYGSVLRDCSRAISLGCRSSKAHYRSALALVALERFEEALDCCNRCLEFVPSNAGMQNLRDRSQRGKELQDKKDKEKKERKHREAEARRHLELGFKARNIIPIKSPNLIDNPYRPHFVTHPQSSKPSLVFPVFFLYPQHATSDLVSHYDEETPFHSHLDAMFPPSASENADRRPHWDKNGDYISTNLVVYAITHKRRLLKVGKRMTLHEVCNAAGGNEKEADGLELKDGCLTVVVLPRGEVETKWVEDFNAASN